MKSSTFFPKTERDALIVLNAVSGFTNRRIVELIGHLGSPQKIFELSQDELVRGCGLPQQAVLNFAHFSAEEFLKNEEAQLKAYGSRIITAMDTDYPESLKKISDAPILLYLAGKLPTRLDCACAIVGARGATLYGMEIAERFARELSELGVPIISGLARGVDAAAHRGCLKAGGETLAVLGCGLDVIYPTENKDLYAAIREKGGIISEFPFGTQPIPYNFPRRNRIVSGLSLGVIVVEARQKSGALITADFAVEQGREVFAVPGRVDSLLSEGPHALIKQGAKVVLSIQDILDELPVRVIAPEDGLPSRAEVLEDLEGDEKVVFEIVKEGATSLDALGTKTGHGPSKLMGPLLTLQLKRLIRELPGKVYELFKS